MLVNCPKCGFSQPKDKYCANCGVDMEMYRPNPVSFWQKLSSNTSLLLLAAIIATVGGYVYISSNSPSSDTSTKNSAARFLVKASDVNSTEISASPEAIEASEAGEENKPSTSSEEVKSSAMPAATASTEIAELPQVEAEPEAIPAIASRAESPSTVSVFTRGFQSKGLKASVFFVELPTASLELWSRESQALKDSQFQKTSTQISGPLSQLKSKLTSAGIKVLHKAEAEVSARSPVYQFFTGAKHRSGDLELDQGISFYTGLSVNSENQISAEIDLQKALLETNQMHRESFQGSFVFNPDQGAFITLNLPRNFAFESRDYSKPADWFQVFTSPNFKSGRSHFTIVVQLEPLNAL
jgi:hypothetical protein